MASIEVVIKGDFSGLQRRLNRMMFHIEIIYLPKIVKKFLFYLYDNKQSFRDWADRRIKSKLHE